MSDAEKMQAAEALEQTSPLQACRIYRSIIKRDPSRSDAHVNLGRLYHEAGKVQTALKHYDAALTIEPLFTIARFNRAVALQDLGQHIEAFASYFELVRDDPSFSDARYNLQQLAREYKLTLFIPREI